MKKEIVAVVLAVLLLPLFIGCGSESDAKTQSMSAEELIQANGIDKCKEIAKAWQAFYNWNGYWTKNIHALDSIPDYEFTLSVDSVYQYSLVKHDWCWGFLGCDRNRPSVRMIGNLDKDPALDQILVLAQSDSLYVMYEFNDLVPRY